MDSTNTNLLELQIDATSHAILREASKWAKFLSIVGFIFCGLMVLIGIFAASIFSTMGTQYGGTAMAAGMGSLMTVVYILLALIYFFPCLFLYKFGTKTQLALRSNDQQQLSLSLGNLKSYFKFLGILTIIGLSIWVLAFIFGGLGAAFSGMS
jgi:Family of unknown function (DUF5362)